MPKTDKRHTMKAGSSAHLKAYLNEGHSVASLAEILSMHVTTVSGWLAAPGSAPMWTATIMEQRAMLATGKSATGMTYLLVAVPPAKNDAVTAVLKAFNIDIVKLTDVVK